MLTFIDANPRTKLKWTAKGEFQEDKSGASAQELAFLSAASILLEVEVSGPVPCFATHSNPSVVRKKKTGCPDLARKLAFYCLRSFSCRKILGSCT